MAAGDYSKYVASEMDSASFFLAAQSLPPVDEVISIYLPNAGALDWYTLGKPTDVIWTDYQWAPTAYQGIFSGGNFVSSHGWFGSPGTATNDGWDVKELAQTATYHQHGTYWNISQGNMIGQIYPLYNPHTQAMNGVSNASFTNNIGGLWGHEETMDAVWPDDSNAWDLGATAQYSTVMQYGNLRWPWRSEFDVRRTDYIKPLLQDFFAHYPKPDQMHIWYPVYRPKASATWSEAEFPWESLSKAGSSYLTTACSYRNTSGSNAARAAVKGFNPTFVLGLRAADFSPPKSPDSITSSDINGQGWWGNFSLDKQRSVNLPYIQSPQNPNAGNGEAWVIQDFGSISNDLLRTGYYVVIKHDPMLSWNGHYYPIFEYLIYQLGGWGFTASVVTENAGYYVSFPELEIGWMNASPTSEKWLPTGNLAGDIDQTYTRFD